MSETLKNRKCSKKMELKKCEEPLTKDVCLANRTSLSLPPQFSPTNFDEIKKVENKFPYDIEKTKKNYKKFCELSKDEKEIIFKSKVLFQGTTVIFGVLINNNEKLCERLSPEQIDEMLNGEVVSFFNPLKQPSKEYREKKFKKNIDDSDDYFSKVNNGGKNQDNNDTLRSSGGDQHIEDDQSDSNNDKSNNEKNSDSASNQQPDKSSGGDDDDDDDKDRNKGNKKSDEITSDDESESSLTIKDLISISQKQRVILIGFVYGEKVTDTLFDVSNRMQKEIESETIRPPYIFYFDLEREDITQILHDLSYDKNDGIIYKLSSLSPDKLENFKEDLFVDYYTNGDIVFFWDNSESAEEVKEAKEQLFEIFKEIYDKTKNQQWIVSSIFSVEKFEKYFGCYSYSLCNHENYKFKKYIKIEPVGSTYENIRIYMQEYKRSSNHYKAHEVLYRKLTFEKPEDDKETLTYLVMKQVITAIDNDKLKDLEVLDLEITKENIVSLENVNVFKKFENMNDFEIYSEYFTFIIAKYIEENIFALRKTKIDQKELKLRIIFLLKVINLYSGIQKVLSDFLSDNEGLKITATLEIVLYKNCDEFMKLLTKDSWKIFKKWIKNNEKVNSKFEEFKNRFL